MARRRTDGALPPRVPSTGTAVSTGAIPSTGAASSTGVSPSTHAPPSAGVFCPQSGYPPNSGCSFTPPTVYPPTSAGGLAPSPFSGFPPSSTSWMDAATSAAGGNGSPISPSTLTQAHNGSDPASVNMQQWGNGTHPPGGFMSYFYNQATMPQNFHFVGGPSHFTSFKAPRPSDANGTSPPPDETSTQHTAVRNQESVSLDSEDDNGVVRTNIRLNWTQDEDVRLMSSWLNNSMDPINGNDKKADKYWGDVAKAYNSTTPRNRWRNPKQAKERWHRINRWKCKMAPNSKLISTQVALRCWKCKRSYLPRSLSHRSVHSLLPGTIGLQQRTIKRPRCMRRKQRCWKLIVALSHKIQHKWLMTLELSMLLRSSV